MSTTTTASIPAPTHTNPGPSQSKPLLFFVALGFGVVFTNLWIIVGVKYCFRYQRARHLAALGGDAGDGEGLDLHAMPRQRRRREKKLMSMEDVNERFPLIKYKIWRAGREQKGLPAAGGVTATVSRAGSIKEGLPLEKTSAGDATLSRYIETVAPTSTDLGTRPIDSDHKDFVDVSLNGPVDGPSSPSSQEKAAEGARHGASVEDAEEDEDDPIRTAVPTELLGEPGDACAICIDSLDDDDEVRGLTCGHAFHASCIDPWLTSRRACCPLCKADYYIPKPRADGEAAPLADGEVRSPVVPPSNIWVGGGGRYLFAAPRQGEQRTRVNIAGSRYAVETDRYGFPMLMREPRLSRRAEQRRLQQEEQEAARRQQSAQHPSEAQGLVPQVERSNTGGESAMPIQTQTQPQSSWFRNTFLNTQRNVPALPRFGGRSRGSEPSALDTTPGQLEAGVAPATMSRI